MTSNGVQDVGGIGKVGGSSYFQANSPDSDTACAPDPPPRHIPGGSQESKEGKGDKRS